MDSIRLENRHTGELLEIRRVNKDGQECLELRGTLPPHREGPPLHVHYDQLEEGRVTAGTLSAVVDGRQIQLRAGESGQFPAGSVHRWWNAGNEMLAVEGSATPASDLDRYLQAVFDVINSGPSDRPPLFYIAHVAWRHRRTQAVTIMPRPIQAVVIPMVVLIGTILGRYRGTDWPGSPQRSTGAPAVNRQKP